MSVDKTKLIGLLSNYNQDEVKKYADYCEKLCTEKNKDGSFKNPYALKISDEKFADCFMQVAKDGLVLDGEHITIQRTGVTYDYIAYKNKMFLAYPESTIDVQLVYKDDTFSFAKKDGKVTYTHQIGNPFAQKDEDVIGGYCVIKNKRGEFFTSLSKDEIEKHRKIAKTDSIWKQWFKEMALKTIIKKACRTHFADIYQNIETIDNENYDIETPIALELEVLQAIKNIEDVDTLKEYYLVNKDSVADRKAFDKAVSMRKKEIANGDN